MEQFLYLLFLKRLDKQQDTNEKRARHLTRKYTPRICTIHGECGIRNQLARTPHLLYQNTINRLPRDLNAET
ncbi:MAG: hypothetical protein EYC68_08105 [Chloroflexota bacterium]|nr:MAG: hypothetical protein EYC68_08105 [Chloroflexota bacterium]